LAGDAGETGAGSAMGVAEERSGPARRKTNTRRLMVGGSGGNIVGVVWKWYRCGLGLSLPTMLMVQARLVEIVKRLLR